MNWILASLVMSFLYQVHSLDSYQAEGINQINLVNGTEHHLYDLLFRSYNKNVRPRKDPSFPVYVNVTLSLSKVVNLDEKGQTLSTNLWLWMTWVDDFLQWDPTEYPNITYLIVPSEKLWVPDIFVTNILGNTQTLARQFFGRAEGGEISPTGRVSLWIPLLLNTFCSIDIEMFPFDTQSCHITFNSWIHDVRQLQIHHDEKSVNVVAGYKWPISPLWILKSLTSNMETFSEGEEHRKYDVIFLNFLLKRKSTFYVVNLIIPCYLISLISCISLLLPSDSPTDRINLLLTTFLAILVFVLVVLEIVPEESDSLPLFSKLLLSVMILNMGMIIYCTLSARMVRRPENSLVPANCFLKAFCAKDGEPENLEYVEVNKTQAESKGLHTQDQNTGDVKTRTLNQWTAVLNKTDKILFIFFSLGLTVGFLGLPLILSS